jgi:hypothetical protein
MQIIEKHKGKPGELLSVLQDIQILYGYLPETALRTVAENTSYPLVDIYGVVTFFDAFKPAPLATSPDEAGKNSEEDEASYARSVKCSYCSHELLDDERRIADRPAVRITISFGMEHGSFYFASYYLAPDMECEFDLPQKGEINFFCPHCHAELMPAANCPECGAPMIPVLSRDSGMIPICSSLDCKSRELKLGEKRVEHPETTTVGV